MSACTSAPLGSSSSPREVGEFSPESSPSLSLVIPSTGYKSRLILDGSGCRPFLSSEATEQRGRDTCALWLPGYSLSEPHRPHWLDRGVLKRTPVIPWVEEASFCAPLPKPGFLVPPSTHLLCEQNLSQVCGSAELPAC